MLFTKSLKNIYHFGMAYLGKLIYLNPSRDIFVIGVTGTKGKTTVAELVNAGLEEAGYTTALNSSLRTKIGDKNLPSRGNSMPGRFYLQKFLRNAVKTKCDFAVIEVTSEGVKQYRHRGIHFDVGVFTNLHPEHIESHGSFEKYKQAKLNFFNYIRESSKKDNKKFFVNYEDDNFRDFATAGSRNVYFFGKRDIPSNLIGEFNQINMGAAESLLKSLGVKEEIIKRAFKKFVGVPGRMELIQEKPFKIVIDYAHTPDSLEAVYKSLSAKGSQLVCVLGSAGGGRDKWKRPKFGEIASKYCKEIILTNEDPFDEDPKKILEEIKSGALKRGHEIRMILDRKKAIKKAVHLAEEKDTVIITGKGSEPYIRVAAGKKLPWSDRRAVEEILREKRLE